jgi:hypothetical protein
MQPEPPLLVEVRGGSSCSLSVPLFLCILVSCFLFRSKLTNLITLLPLRSTLRSTRQSLTPLPLHVVPRYSVLVSSAAPGPSFRVTMCPRASLPLSFILRFIPPYPPESSLQPSGDAHPTTSADFKRPDSRNQQRAAREPDRDRKRTPFLGRRSGFTEQVNVSSRQGTVAGKASLSELVCAVIYSMSTDASLSCFSQSVNWRTLVSRSQVRS